MEPSRKPPGRPSTGYSAGHRITLQLPAEAKARVMAIAALTGRPAWRLVAEAIDLLWNAQPAEKRRALSEAAKAIQERYAASGGE
jgi:poly(3-hydroxybutyrate) depolymerase